MKIKYLLIVIALGAIAITQVIAALTPAQRAKQVNELSNKLNNLDNQIRTIRRNSAKNSHAAQKIKSLQQQKMKVIQLITDLEANAYPENRQKAPAPDVGGSLESPAFGAPGSGGVSPSRRFFSA